MEDEKKVVWLSRVFVVLLYLGAVTGVSVCLGVIVGFVYMFKNLLS